MKIAKLPPKKTPSLKTFAVWHSLASPEIVEGYSAVVSHDRVTIDQGPGKTRVITGIVIVTEPGTAIKFS